MEAQISGFVEAINITKPLKNEELEESLYWNLLLTILSISLKHDKVAGAQVGIFHASCIRVEISVKASANKQSARNKCVWEWKSR